MDCVREGVIATDEEDKVVECNAVAREILGVDKNKLMGYTASDIFGMISKETRMTPPMLMDALLDGIKQAANIAIPTDACGIMIGIVVCSGVANKLTGIISSVGSANIAIALIIAMLGCMLLGMALPTVATYLIANILFCPTIIALGIPALPANMFIFYFGVIAQITPPVCLASFTYALVSFLTPYVFVFQPAILLQGTAFEVVTVSAVMTVGIVFLATGMSGYIFISIDSIPIRLIMSVVAIFVILPEPITTVVGFIIGFFIVGTYCLKSKKEVKRLSV